MQVFEGCTECPVPNLMHRRRVAPISGEHLV
jgi:hypothetical protein